MTIHEFKLNRVHTLGGGLHFEFQIPETGESSALCRSLDPVLRREYLGSVIPTAQGWRYLQNPEIVHSAPELGYCPDCEAIRSHLLGGMLHG